MSDLPDRRGLLTSDYDLLAARLMAETTNGTIVIDDESIKRLLQEEAADVEIPEAIDYLLDELLTMLATLESL